MHAVSRLSMGLSRGGQGQPTGAPARWSRGAGLVLLVATIYVLGEAVRWGGPAGLRWWADGGWTLAGGLALGACLHTVRRTPWPARLAWTFFALACGSWLVGQLFWDYFDLWARIPPSPAPHDLGYLGFVPLCIAGLVSIGTGPRLTRVLLGCDTGVAAFAFAIAFIALFWPNLFHSSLHRAALSTVMMYPVFYATLGVAALLVPVQRAWRMASLRWLLLGVSGQVAAFILWTPPLLSGTWAEGTPLDVLWLGGMMLIAVGALSFESFPAVDAEAQVHGSIAAVPLALSGGAIVLVVHLLLTGMLPTTMEPIMAALVLGLVSLTLLRLGLTLHLSKRWYHRAVAATRVVRESEVRYRALSENATDLVAVVDREGRFTYVSPSFKAIMGYDPAQLSGTSFYDLLDGDDRTAISARWADRLSDAQSTTHTEVHARHADRSWRWLEVTGRVALETPAIGGVIFNARDITLRRQIEDELRHQALHDTLTGLPNRTLFQDRLDQALRGAQRAGGSLAVLLLDLDRFKEVNDTFGHQQGDALLSQVAQRLPGLLRAADTVARLGGDDFALILSGIEEAGALVAAERLRTLLDVPFGVEQQTLHVAASVGIALYPQHGQDGTALLRCAEVAMYAAKETSTRSMVYSPAHDPHTPDRLALGEDLRDALACGALAVHYQPKVDVQSGRVLGVEALARWTHPQRGPVPPDQFIALAEQTGLMASLTHWVLNEAVRQCAAWQQAVLPLAVAVNLSTINLLDPQLPGMIAQVLQRHGVPPLALRLEVTESTLMTDPRRAQEVLTAIAALGVGISVDDYGTGYSSLAYLKRLPVDELKIDRSFVQHMADDASDAAIVASTIGLAHRLGLHVVAEGVEDSATWETLADQGCDIVQGYYLSRPLPAADLERWLRAPRRAGGERGEQGLSVLTPSAYAENSLLRPDA